MSSILLACGMVLLSVIGAVELVKAFQEGLGTGHDFVQDYAAVVKIGEWRNPYEPYNDVTQQVFGGPPHRGRLYSFHAPTSLPLVIWLLPFAKMGGYTAAYMAWGAVNLVSLWAICWLTLRAVGIRWPWLFGYLLAMSIINLPAIRENFVEGQLNVAVAAGMVGCWAARRAGHSRLAGVLLALAFALKPIPGLFFIYYAWRRDLTLLMSAAVTLAILTVLGIGLAGVSGTLMWANVNYPSHANYWPSYPDNASIRGFFTRIFGPINSDWRIRPLISLPIAAMLCWVSASGLLTLLSLAIARGGFGVRKARPWEADRSGLWLQLSRLQAPAVAREDARADLEVAVLTALTLLVTPIVWPHYYVVLVMPVTVIGIYLGRLVMDGAAWTRPAWLDAYGPAPQPSVGAEGTPVYDVRRRIVPTVALIGLVLATLFLASAQYVEPYRGAGGQLLIALLTVFGAALVALGWCVRDQGRVNNPEAAR